MLPACNAFDDGLSGIDDSNLDGISLTHETSGFKDHIWSLKSIFQAVYQQSY